MQCYKHNHKEVQLIPDLSKDSSGQTTDSKLFAAGKIRIKLQGYLYCRVTQYRSRFIGFLGYISTQLPELAAVSDPSVPFYSTAQLSSDLQGSMLLRHHSTREKKKEDYKDRGGMCTFSQRWRGYLKAPFPLTPRHDETLMKPRFRHMLVHQSEMLGLKHAWRCALQPSLH